MASDIQLSTEMAKRVEDILEAGATRLVDISKVVGGLADEARLAHTGSGTGQMEENYRSLQATGIGISMVIERLAEDFDLNINTGFEMEDLVNQEMTRANPGGGGSGGVDPLVARAV